MKKGRSRTSVRKDSDADTMLAEYDFSHAVRGATAARYAQGANIVRLDPDVAAIFRNARAVNEALRTVARVVRSKSRRRSRKRSA